MREILFRGKSIKYKYWHEGELINTTGKIPPYMPMIIKTSENGNSEAFDVDPETVGQYTGVTDKNGKRIFEGDIIRAKIEGGNHEGFTWQNMPVDFQQGAFCLNDRNGHVFCVLGAFAPSVSLEVIGNIHDNPELLKGGD